MKRLYRSRTNTVLGGVCSGLGQYFGIDPTLVRLVFVLLALSGTGILAYLILWIIIPVEDRAGATTGETIKAGAEEIAEKAKALGESVRDHSGPASGALLFGAILVGVGGLLLLKNLDLHWLRWFSMRTFWPLILIGIGIVLLIPRMRGK